MNNLKLTKKKDLILTAVIIVIAIVMYIIMNQMQSDNGEIVKITVDGNVYGTYSLTKNQEIEIKTDKLQYQTIQKVMRQMLLQNRSL